MSDSEPDNSSIQVVSITGDEIEVRQPRPVKIHPTNERLEAIAKLYTSGVSLRRISQMPDMPRYNDLLEWKATSDRFADVIEKASEMKALDAEEQIREIMDRPVIGEKEAAGLRVKMEAAKWMAERNNPSKYGNKTQISGDKKNPVVFKIMTNVPENPNQVPPKLDERGVIDVTSTVVEPRVEPTDEDPDGS